MRVSQAFTRSARQTGSKTEFGTIRTEDGFRNLYEMDTIQHVHPGVQYPAVLIVTGLNDPRVSPWEPAKLAAALQASGTSRPILLRIDEEAGHGIGSTKSQDDALYTDMWTFVFWRAGLSGWQPLSRLLHARRTVSLDSRPGGGLGSRRQ